MTTPSVRKGACRRRSSAARFGVKKPQQKAKRKLNRQNAAIGSITRELEGEYTQTRGRIFHIGDVAVVAALGCLQFRSPDLADSYCVISDSGTLTEEAALLDIPAGTVRDAHERPEGMDARVLVRSGFAIDGLLDAVRIVRASSRERHFSGEVKDYICGLTASHKVMRIVASYIDVVNRVVWSRPEAGP